MRERAFVRTITVRRMYGIRFDLHVERLSPGINVIFGANGSGKTTIAHAIQTILLKGYVHAKQAAVDASLLIGDQELRIDIDGPRRQCTRNGVQFDWKTAPELFRPESYHLSLHELLSAETADSELANEILREASGGFDIGAAQESLGFFGTHLKRGKLNRMLEAAQKEVRSVKLAQSKLLRDKGQCKKLEVQLKAAREAGTRASLLEQAMDYQAARQTWEQARDALEAYPEVIRKSADLSNVVEDASKLKGTIVQLEDRCRNKQHQIESYELSLSKSPLPANGLPDGVLTTVASQIDRLRNLSAQIEILEYDLAGAQKVADNSWKDLGGVAGGPEHFAREQVRQLRQLAESTTDLSNKRAALDALQRVLKIEEGVDPEAESERLRRAQDAFAKWLLAQRRPAPRIVKSLLAAAMVGSTVLATSGFAISVFGFIFVGVSVAVLGIIVTVLIAMAYAQLARANDASAERAELKRIYPELTDQLGHDDALAVLEDLLNRRGNVAAMRAKQQRWEATSGDLERLEKDQARLENEREEFAAQTGLSGKADDAASVYVLERLLSWRERTDAVQKLAGQRDNSLKAFASTLTELNGTLSKYGQPEAVDEHEAAGRSESLRVQDATWKRDHDQLDTVRNQFEGAQEDLAREQRNYERIFGHLELEVGDFEELREYALKHAECKKAAEREVKERAILEDKKRAIQKAPGFTNAMLDADDLDRALENARAMASKRDDLLEKISKINLEVAQAEEGHSLERALSDVRQAQDSLTQARDSAVASAIGEVLANHLSERAREMQLPKVFHRAKENFLKVTRGRYTLDVQADGHFGARDNERAMDLELSELSSATRVQLLLCVRLAFVQEQELEYCLPVTLDETLGNSDDERARVIIQTMSELADERQVFYFTAQQDEVIKWEELCGVDNINIVALSELRPHTPVDPDALPSRPLLHAPNGLTHTDYGRKLRAPRWSGHDPVNSIHLWYLMEDTGQLHTLLNQGVSTWGAIKALHSGGLSELPAPVWKQLDLLARALESWQSGWRTGRGKPVDRAVLEASGAVSDRFIEDVLARCADPGEDGSDLLHALKNNRIKGFGPSKIAELDVYLQDHGFIAQDEKRSGSRIRSDALASVANDLAECGLDHTAVDRMLTRVSTGP